MKRGSLIIVIVLNIQNLIAQDVSIQDLDFLIGTWQVREENTEKTWWEKSTRTARYIMDSTYIELVSSAVQSNGKKRNYRWYIHYNKKEERFEMVSMFSNWHKIQFDILKWDSKNRKLIIRNDIESHTTEYHERYGEIIFNENFSEYIWLGENKYGNKKEPSIWLYEEKGVRID